MLRVSFMLLLLLLFSTFILSTAFDAKKHHNYNPETEEAKKHIKEQLEELGANSEFKAEDLDHDDFSLWFSLGDTDGNGKLDGHELVMQLNEGFIEHEDIPLEETLHHIDQVLLEDDLDGDGMISYEEFKASEAVHDLE